MKPITNVVGFDDAPYAHEHRGDVRVVGAVCSRTRLDGVLSGKVRRDGVSSTDALIELVRGGKFREHVRCVLLQGIALAGFNVALDDFRTRDGRGTSRGGGRTWRALRTAHPIADDLAATRARVCAALDDLLGPPRAAPPPPHGP